MSKPGAKAGAGQTPKPKRAPRKPGRPPKAQAMDDKVRAYIVTRMACYDSVKDIHASLVEMGIDITPQAVSRYNPENVNGPAPKWKALFDQAREDFLRSMSKEPLFNRQFRMRKLHTIFEKHMAKAQYVLAAQILEQAAKEAGNVYTNVAKVQGNLLGQPPIVETTPDERRNMLADRLKDAIASRAPKQLTQH